MDSIKELHKDACYLSPRNLNKLQQRIVSMDEFGEHKRTLSQLSFRPTRSYMLKSKIVEKTIQENLAEVDQQIVQLEAKIARHLSFWPMQ